jgi:hypothetical protein
MGLEDFSPADSNSMKSGWTGGPIWTFFPHQIDAVCINVTLDAKAESFGYSRGGF